MKKDNKKIAKRRLKRELKDEIREMQQCKDCYWLENKTGVCCCRLSGYTDRKPPKEHECLVWEPKEIQGGKDA